MSGPVSTTDVDPVAGAAVGSAPCVDVFDARVADVGGFPVRRALPRRLRRTVGPWCFADHMGPAAVQGQAGIGIGPHPHIGLQTVTWLFAGEVLHRDSLGSEQVIRPGQLNLMTAGRGVVHAEEGTGYAGELHGIQLWVAQPEATRHGSPAFEHHAQLPQVELLGAEATILIGQLGTTTSPARRDTDHVGVDLALAGGSPVLVPLHPAFEYALMVCSGEVAVGGTAVATGQLAYLGTGRHECRLSVPAPARALLLGGRPFDEPVVMWWNYVARHRDEITAAHRSWTADDVDRFGPVVSSLSRMDAPGPPWA